MKRREAAELIRPQQQGLGNPMVSLKMNGHQIIRRNVVKVVKHVNLDKMDNLG